MAYPTVPDKRNPQDIIVRQTNDINAPIDTVFEVIEDLQLFVELEQNVRSVTITSAIKKGKGVKSHWVLDDPDTGGAWELDEEIIYYDKPHQYAYVGDAGGKDYAGIHTLTVNPDGTTHHMFNEVFHFEADPEEFSEIVGGMMANVKREAEKRAQQ